ncbi:GL16513 [Drosophila persimilis]|uniref:Mitogen-activated protein kinase n=1 Tax=Drosophila persimilis TaxID=7234 RepID=B4GW84_DROPE|nr:GL16513 [Drosophila persimilis]
MANKSKTESNYELDKNVTAIFDVRKALGKGAYGIVWKAIDKRQRDTVALKKIYDAFRDTTDAQRTYREVIFLRAFRHHPNIIRLLGIYRATNNMDFYLVFEHMESDLHIVIKKRDILKDIHRQFVMYQLVNAIKYVHSGNVIHRDLKPSNILIDSKCRLKVGDFGLARTVLVKPSERGTGDATGLHDAPTENDGMMSDYVATRWYRAPEILVGCRRYTKAVDMWSLGCILGEMITEQPIFQGSSTINQMEKILSALPNVTQREIDDIGTRFGTSLLCRSIRRDYQHSLNAMCRGCDSDEIGFTTSLLMLDPKDRITANKALKHPFVSSFRCPSAEMEMRLNVQPPLRDDYRFALDDYRNSLYGMISKELGTGHRITQSCRTPTTVPRDSAALRELPFGCRTRRSDNTRNEKSFLLEALLRRKQRETNSLDPDMDAKVQANLDRLQAERKKMQKKILKYAAETGLMIINENSKNNGSDRSKTVYSSDSEAYFTPTSRKTVVKKTLIKKYNGNRDVKHHGNNITELHESTSSYKFKKQQHDVFDASEKGEQQVGDAKDFLEAKYCLTHELPRHEMEKDRYDSIIPSGVRHSPDDSFNTRPTPGKQHTILKPMYLDLFSTLASAPAPVQTLLSSHTVKEPRRRKHISGDNFQPLHQRHISEIQATRINDD